MALTKRLVKGTPLTFAEGDNNLDYLYGLAVNTGSFVRQDETGSFIRDSQTGSFIAVIKATGSSLYSSATSIQAGIPGNVASAIFIGNLAGSGSTNANNSTFIGQNAGYTAENADNSTFIGYQAGYNAVNAQYSAFIGTSAGNGAVYANNSVFIGGSAGQNATNGSFSNFIGATVGYGATNAAYSNFMGYNAGYNAVDSLRSNFLGIHAGYGASKAAYSNFIGNYAGSGATFASSSNLIGDNAGINAASASYSNLIGFKAGSGYGGSIGRNNIIIGTNISLESGRKDSVNIGGIIFATGSYFNVGGSVLEGPVGGAKVGINNSLPTYNFDISGSLRAQDGFVVFNKLIDLNFAGGDTEASASGVPVGGLYRSGSFVQIRLS